MRALDLFCGAGGAAMGLHRAGFEVVGVDIKPQPRFPFEFLQGDALNPPVDLSAFDLIWASPPCQAYSQASRPQRKLGVIYPETIGIIQDLLGNGKTMTCIENVPEAPLRPDLVLDGTMFPNLKVIRRRVFELNFPAPFRLGFNAQGHVTRHDWSSVHGHDISSHIRERRRKLGRPLRDTFSKRCAAMNIDWMSRDELAQAIPPAYSEFIARAALQWMKAEAA